MFLCGWEHASLGFSRQKDRRRDRKARCLVFMTRRESGMERRLVSLLTREGKEKRRRGCGEWNGWTETSCCAESNVSWFKKKKKKKKEKRGDRNGPAYLRSKRAKAPGSISCTAREKGAKPRRRRAMHILCTCPLVLTQLQNYLLPTASRNAKYFKGSKGLAREPPLPPILT